MFRRAPPKEKRLWLLFLFFTKKTKTFGRALAPFFKKKTKMFDRASLEEAELERSPIKALFSSQKNLQNFSYSPSHRIFRHMHGVLNIDENKN